MIQMRILNAVMASIFVFPNVDGLQFSGFSSGGLRAREDSVGRYEQVNPISGLLSGGERAGAGFGARHADLMSGVGQNRGDFNEIGTLLGSQGSTIRTDPDASSTSYSDPGATVPGYRRAGNSISTKTKVAGQPGIVPFDPPPKRAGPAIIPSGKFFLPKRSRAVGSPPKFSDSKAKYPYNVSLRRRLGGAHFCGGALIGPRHVLTAAHCVVDSGNGDSRPVVVVGAAFISQTTGVGVEVFSTKDVAFHPKYTSSRRYPDLAILELDGVSLTPPVALPVSTKHHPNGGDVLTSMGWGRTSLSSGASDIVQVVETEYINRPSCMRKIRRQIRPDQMCSGGKGVGSCTGDGGGPIVIRGETREEDLLVGIVGSMHTCGGSTPDVDTRIAPSIDWMVDTKAKYAIDLTIKSPSGSSRLKHKAFLEAITPGLEADLADLGRHPDIPRKAGLHERFMEAGGRPGG